MAIPTEIETAPIKAPSSNNPHKSSNKSLQALKTEKIPADNKLKLKITVKFPYHHHKSQTKPQRQPRTPAQNHNMFSSNNQDKHKIT